MNIKKGFLLTGISVILTVGLVACDKPGPAEQAGKSIDQATEKAGDKMDEAGVAFDDSAITAKVKTAILGEAGLKVLQINVDTSNGVTTLSGSVDSQQSSDKAKETAIAVAGVKEVENKLVVKSSK